MFKQDTKEMFYFVKSLKNLFELCI
jgi:hypothetical protein